MNRKKLLLSAVICAVGAASWAPAMAQEAPFPTKPITLVIPFPPGGATDVLGRLIAQQLGTALGTSVIIDNKGGAGGSVGSEIASRAAPDGFTMLGGTISSHAINISLYPKLGYDPQKSFAPVTLIGTNPVVLVVNQAPATPKGRSVGAVITLRDHTDLQALTGELDSVRAFAESLRAQAHEAANRLHTTVSLVELGRSAEAVEFATAELALAQRLTDRVVGAVEEPVLAALLLGKAATAHERGVAMEIDPATSVGSTGIPGGDLVTIVGNLLDNAIDAALAGDAPREVQLSLWEEDGMLELRVEDTGPGVPDPEQVFQRGWSTKADGPRGNGRGLGLALVAQAVRRNGGTVSVRPGPGAEFRVSLPLRSTAGVTS